MASYGLNDIKNGLRLLIDSAPCVLIDTDYVKPGKGQAFTRYRYRNLLNGRVVERTVKSGDSVESADVVDTNMQFLYTDGEYWHFMVPDTYEQHQADKAGVGDASKWLKAEDMVQVTLWNSNPILVTPPNFVELQITQSDPGVRGDTSGGGNKPATLDTGAVIQVPVYLNQDEYVKVDTRTRTYVERVSAPE